MKRTISFGFALAALALASCSNNSQSETPAISPAPAYDEIKKAAWLIGSWQGSSPDGVFGEYWQISNDSIFAGKGYFVVGKDTVSLESLRLVQEGSKLFYDPTVKNQNDGKAVRFAMKSITDDAMVFENATHDFPQKIMYRLINPDSVVAEISGQFEGKPRLEMFPMHRMK